jgi:hypothetical protein
MEKNRLSEEEKGKARVIVTMCGGVIPAWAMPENDVEENKEDENNEER